MLSSERLREILDDLDQEYGSDSYRIKTDWDYDIGIYRVDTDDEIAYIFNDEWFRL